MKEVLRRRAEVARVGGRRADERDDAALAAGNPLEEGLDAPRVADRGAGGSRHRQEEPGSLVHSSEFTPPDFRL